MSNTQPSDQNTPRGINRPRLGFLINSDFDTPEDYLKLVAGEIAPQFSHKDMYLSSNVYMNVLAELKDIAWHINPEVSDTMAMHVDKMVGRALENRDVIIASQYPLRVLTEDIFDFDAGRLKNTTGNVDEDLRVLAAHWETQFFSEAKKDSPRVTIPRDDSGNPVFDPASSSWRQRAGLTRPSVRRLTPRAYKGLIDELKDEAKGAHRDDLVAKLDAVADMVAYHHGN